MEIAMSSDNFRYGNQHSKIDIKRCGVVSSQECYGAATPQARSSIVQIEMDAGFVRRAGSDRNSPIVLCRSVPFVNPALTTHST